MQSLGLQGFFFPHLTIHYSAPRMMKGLLFPSSPTLPFPVSSSDLSFPDLYTVCATLSNHYTCYQSLTLFLHLLATCLIFEVNR